MVNVVPGIVFIWLRDLHFFPLCRGSFFIVEFLNLTRKQGSISEQLIARISAAPHWLELTSVYWNCCSLLCPILYPIKSHGDFCLHLTNHDDNTYEWNCTRHWPAGYFVLGVVLLQFLFNLINFFMNFHNRLFVTSQVPQFSPARLVCVANIQGYSPKV